MPSIPRFVISLALVFATQVESRAYPLAEANDGHGLRARQVATSATATATDVGSVVAGNLLGALAAGASASSASVAAASASVASVASNLEAEGSICNGDTDRNQSAWIQFDIGDWFKNQTKFYTVNNWNNPDGTPIQSIQKLILSWAGDGENQCGMLSTDCNPNPQYSQCLKYPQANFLWFATATFSNYLGNMKAAVDTSSLVLTNYVGTMVSEFYTPRQPPGQLIAPISIVAGIAAGISSFFPPAAVVAGAGSIANGILTQKGLNQPNPTLQWSDASAQLGNITQQLIDFLQSYWTTQLDSQPSRLTTDGLTYDEDPAALPAILAPGGFANDNAAYVGSFPNGIYGSLGSAGINALWNEDMAFILKISDSTLGQGAGSACKQFPAMTYCDPEGVAYIFMRWTFTIQIPSPAKKVSVLDQTNWQVWGAYDSLPGNPSGNANNLGKYGLDLGIIARSAWRVQQAHGFWTDETPQATITSVQANITNLDLSQIVSWNMAVCDLDGILDGAHFTSLATKGTGWTAFITCACTTMKDLNGKAFPLPFPSNNAEPLNVCSQAWTSTTT